MCGIFGVIITSPTEYNENKIYEIIKSLYFLSETRGKEAAGAVLSNEDSVDIYKDALSATQFIKSNKFNAILSKSLHGCIKSKKSFSLIGHSRLVTNGAHSNNINNQPVVSDNQIGVHNGIITNYKNLWKKNKFLKKETELDTEILFKLIDKEYQETDNLDKSLINIFGLIEGTASIATFLRDQSKLLLATNTGSIYFNLSLEDSIFVFASEKYIVEKLIFKKGNEGLFGNQNVQQLQAFEAMKINLDLKKIDKVKLKENKVLNSKIDDSNINYKLKKIPILDYSSNPNNLKRCTKCILPETYPYIDFDANGVCRYCRTHKSLKVKGNLELKKELLKFKRSDNKPDCIVALSGGRDSCYGLHYLKKELGMNPIAFTYDWGFVTDLARRNAARVCGKLGIEHIIRSPNIASKRKYVRQNVKAWLKKPELGMIPLFMAGDKAFFYHANKLKKETGIKLVVFCSGNTMEKAYYKFGLSGMKRGDDTATLSKLGLQNKISLLKYYLKNFIKNPYYLNSSLLDSAAGFFHTFIGKEESLKLYHYIEWNEDKIVKTIIDEYGWETSSETETTWRIGDATAAFYNYIYQTIAGFTEDDDMLSNMIREKYIERGEALRRSKEYAKPRKESISEYLQSIGLNVEETLNIINSAEKLFK